MVFFGKKLFQSCIFHQNIYRSLYPPEKCGWEKCGSLYFGIFIVGLGCSQTALPKSLKLSR